MFQFDTCTKTLGALRQILFSCLTCNPPPTKPSEPYIPAGVCYSCFISCHGEHNLVELFNKRNFVCDCGSTRLPSTSPCTLRINEETGLKEQVSGEKPASSNKYNQNFRNRFCGCGQDYDAHEEKGTMFQCLGLGTEEEGGCGEDWWHPECVIGLPRDWYKIDKANAGEREAFAAPKDTESLAVNAEGDEQTPTLGPPTTNGDVDEHAVDDPDGPVSEDHPIPPGFPHEDDFEYFLCYKCTEAFPWIKKYAGAPGFLPAVLYKPDSKFQAKNDLSTITAESQSISEEAAGLNPTSSLKRKADDEEPHDQFSSTKRQRSTSKSADQLQPLPSDPATCRAPPSSSASTAKLSLFLKDDFRDHLCRCPSCFPLLSPHPQLLDEEETYEPPISEPDDDGNDGDGTGGSVGSRSLLERGEAALNNVDRVRAIEGVMVYNHLKEKVKDFLKPFAENGKMVGAEDIKKYFETLRGDAEAIRQAGGGAAAGGGPGEGGHGGGGDGRREQGGY
ncbi:hypothetical protein LTS18_005463 [Coniosporium uncinatum]|uniref:Uncharacterized protein n=1 Tax=Coniosporium uncinatum TaxID=93489 RepID=A0ACC3D4K0_9PEZI|nr:hypothetical protein LTS18_005463 [Coniosporium uncinatum]